MKWSRLFGGPAPQPRVPHPSGYDQEIKVHPRSWVALLAEQDAAGVPGDADTLMLAAFVSVTEDNTDGAREVIRRLSPKDRAVLSFYIHELSRVLSEEDDFRETEDRRRARLEHRDRTAVDDLLGQGVPEIDDL